MEEQKKLLHGNDCPYSYQCKHMDCLRCIELHQEMKEK